jgi:hypothetical protein
MPSGLARLIGSRATEGQHYRLTPADSEPAYRHGMREEVLLDDRFTSSTLDEAKWFPHYLPAWSSRTATRAAYRGSPGGLVLDIPVDHPVWCPGDHTPPLRVSGIQSGSWSGPVGSTLGQQRYREGLVVREEQPRFAGCLVRTGRVEIEASMRLSDRSMAALWLSGFEDDPDQLQCGELCVFEVFGNALGPADDPSAEVGVGIKAFRDPALTQDFAAPRVPIDVTQAHTYAVEWDAAEAAFTVDGEELRRCPHPPTYSMQLMLAVFDFPEWSEGADDHLVPELTVRRVTVRVPHTG